MFLTLQEKRDMAKFIGKRKHGSQLKEFEVDGLFERLKEVERKGQTWRMAGHALNRLKEKGINATYQDVVSTIHNAQILEYKIDHNKILGMCEERVLLRSKAVVNRNFNLHAVYSLTSRRIVTVWINHVKDFHDTLDWNLYTEDLPVFGVHKQYISNT